MNNEPVAWMQVHYKDGRPTKFSKVQTWEDDIPLYTHPANVTYELTMEKCRQQQAEIEALKYEKSSGVYDLAKTLTDGEIMQVWWDANDITDDDTVIEFARAILRKAQEK